MNYNELMQKPGKRINPVIYYYNDIGDKVTVVHDDIIEARLSYSASIVGTVMKGLTAEIKSQLPDKPIFFQNTVMYNEEEQTKVYGPYYLKESPTYNADSKTYSHTLYDGFLKTMVSYNPIDIQYPTTILAFFKKLCTSCGFSTDIESLPNGDKELIEDIYKDIGYTFRDIFDDIAEATASLFMLVGDNIKKCSFESQNININDDILRNQNIEINSHFGPVNSIVLTRSGDSDSVYKKDETLSSWNEYRIEDNQLMNNDERASFLPAIYDELFGLEFDIYDLKLVGYGGFDPLQKVTISTSNNTYSSYIFNDIQVFTQGYEESIFTEMPEKTNTNYEASTTEDDRLNKVEILVNKNTKEITSIVQTSEAKFSKIHQDVESVTVSISSVTDDVYAVKNNGLNLETKVILNKDGLYVDKNEEVKSQVSDIGFAVLNKKGANSNTQFYSGIVSAELAESNSALSKYKNDIVTYSNNYIFENHLSSQNYRVEEITIDGKGVCLGFFYIGGEK